MPQFGPTLALLPALLALDAALAQDVARGARLYLGLPGGQAACVECHGPDPSLDRNRLLNAARGPAFITEAIRKAAAMGYLADLLDADDRTDVSAFLATVSADVGGSATATVWPWGLEFGRVQPGQAPPVQPVRLRNRGSSELTLSPRLRSLGPDGARGLTLVHDCPSTLAPGAECVVNVGLVAGAEGRVQAALAWNDGDIASARPVGVAATATLAAAGAAQWIDGQPTDRLVLAAPPGTTASVVLTMHNTGTAPLTLGVPAITGPGRSAFRLDPGGCAANLSLPVDGRCTVRLVALAPSAGREEALLQWRNDGSHAPVRRLAVQAVGDAAPPPAPAPSVPPAPAPAPANPAPSLPPAPAAEPVAVGGGGGCSVAWDSSRSDPLLPLITVWAALALWRRERRRAHGQPGGSVRGGSRSPVQPPPLQAAPLPVQ